MHNNINKAAATRLFSRTVLVELAERGKSPTFARLLQESCLINLMPENATLAEVFEEAYRSIRVIGERTAYTYKNAVIEKILLGRHSLKTASAVAEFRVGRSKVDIAIFNGELTAYEIKSERDNLVRLNDQLRSYSAFFPAIYLVCAPPCVDSVLSEAPVCTGVLSLSNRYQLSVIREAVKDVGQTSLTEICNTLRVSEAKLILKECGKPLPAGIPNTAAREIMCDVFEGLDKITVHRLLPKILRQSRCTGLNRTDIQKIPGCLLATVLTARLPSRAINKFSRVLRYSMADAAEWAH